MTRRLWVLACTLLISAVAAVGLATHAQAAISATVVDTGGIGLNVRSGAGVGHEVVARLPEGGTARISCQVVGEPVRGNDVWDYLPAHGGYASDAFLLTGYDGRHPDLPLCSDAGPPADPAPSNPPPSDPAPPAPPVSGVADRIVAAAAGQLGVQEGPDNANPYGPSVEWCQLFVNWAWRQAGVDPVNDSAFTGDFYRWGVQQGLAVDGRAGLRVGDAVLFGTGPSDPSTSRHVGIVAEVRDDGRIVTLDGNYALGGIGQVARVGPYDPAGTSHEPGPVYAYVRPPA